MPRTSKAIAEIDARCVVCDADILDLEAKLDAVRRQHKMLLDLKAALASKPKAKPTKLMPLKTSASTSPAS